MKTIKGEYSYNIEEVIRLYREGISPYRIAKNMGIAPTTIYYGLSQELSEEEYPRPKLVCEICGKEFVRVLSHAWQIHGISAKEYKEKFGHWKSKGYVAEEHRDVLKKRVSPESIESAIKTGEKTRFKKGDEWDGDYVRSKQHRKLLKEHWIKIGQNSLKEKWNKKRKNK